MSENHTTPSVLSVVILAFNRANDLQSTLNIFNSVPDETLKKIELIVVNNASTDRSLEIAESYPFANIVSLPENIGIAGFNRGFDRARGEWILVLDDDSHPIEGCLERFFEIHGRFGDDVAGVACKVLNPNRENSDSTRKWPEELISFWGCGALMRKSVIRQIGGYREDYFLYQNELEWTLRAREAGYRVIYSPELVINHMASPVHRTSSRAFRQNYRNRLHIAWHYYGTAMRWNFLAWAAAITTFKALFRYTPADLLYIWKPFFQDWIWNPRSPKCRDREFQRWLNLPVWKDLELIPPVLTDLPRRLIQRKFIY